MNVTSTATQVNKVQTISRILQTLNRIQNLDALGIFALTVQKHKTF